MTCPMNTSGQFTPRGELGAFEWQDGARNWSRPEIEKSVMERLMERSTLNGVLRVGLFIGLLGVMAAAAILISRLFPRAICRSCISC